MISIPPKYAVAQIIDFVKGKSAIQIARNFVGCKKNFIGQHFWARGYHVSTVGRDEEAIRKYIKEQEKEDHGITRILYNFKGSAIIYNLPNPKQWGDMFFYPRKHSL